MGWARLYPPLCRLSKHASRRIGRWHSKTLSGCAQLGCVNVNLVDPLANKPEAERPAKHPGVVVSVTRDASATLLDLEVLASEITWSPTTPRAGEVVEIQALVRNRGTVPVVAVPVMLAHGEGSARRELLRQTVTLAPGESVSVPFSWTVSLATSPLVLHVIADPFGLLDEVEEAFHKMERGEVLRSVVTI